MWCEQETGFSQVMLIFPKHIKWFWRGYGHQTSFLSKDPGSELQDMGQYSGKVQRNYKNEKHAHTHNLQRWQGVRFRVKWDHEQSETW